MKRCLLTLAGMMSLLSAGCCCDWCKCCNPCGNPCSPCGGSGAYAAPYSPPPGAYYTPYGAPAVGAIGGPITTSALPVESLPTY